MTGETRVVVAREDGRTARVIQPSRIRITRHIIYYIIPYRFKYFSMTSVSIICAINGVRLKIYDNIIL